MVSHAKAIHWCNCDDCIKGLEETYVKICMDTLNTVNIKTYKQFLQDKLVAWSALCPVCCPSACHMSGAAEVDKEDGDEELDRDEGEEGRIAGLSPKLD